jgi:hypothetical protein
LCDRKRVEIEKGKKKERHKEKKRAKDYNRKFKKNAFSLYAEAH